MKILFSFLSLFLFVSTSLRSGQTRQKPSISTEHIYETARKSVVLITTANSDSSISLGSGITIDNDIIATNRHVIEKASTIVISQNNRIWNVSLIYLSKTNDIAFLKVPGLDLKPLQETSAHVKVGNKIYTIGNPEGLSFTLSDGLISSIRNFDDTMYYQITAPISPGSSGGALLDNHGKLLGITTFKIIGGENLNFAIPVSSIMADYRTAQFHSINKIVPQIESKESLSAYISKIVPYIAQPFIIGQDNGNQLIMGNNVKVRFSPDFRYVVVNSTSNYGIVSGTKVPIDDSELKIPMLNTNFKIEKIQVNYANLEKNSYYAFVAETYDNQKTIVSNMGVISYTSKAVLCWSQDHEGLIRVQTAIDKIQSQLKK